MTSWLQEFHDFTKKADPVDHYLMDSAWKSSTGIVNGTSKGLVRVGNALGVNTSIPQMGANTSQKDKESFGRWGENTLGTAGAIIGGGYALGGSGAGAGSGAVAEGGGTALGTGAGYTVPGVAGEGGGAVVGADSLGGAAGTSGASSAFNPEGLDASASAGNLDIPGGGGSKSAAGMNWQQLLGKGMSGMGQQGGGRQPIAAVDFGAQDAQQQAYAMKLAKALKQYGE